MDPFEKEESSEEDPEMEEDDSDKVGNPKHRVPATPSLPMDIDAEEDLQRYIEELGRALNLLLFVVVKLLIVLLGPLFLVGTIPTSPWYYLNDSVHLPIFCINEPVEVADRHSASHDGSSYNLSGVWQSQSSSPSS
ncbi:hypothetical protein PIB30_036871 [Stylosanthes scabra]|uniref:Uncharacterized protein n=1 Tax=Stylosanthes scabra TaxID=79078 RepID=A0ABU6WBU8_9FABA|nr:hypothetical protein [Stylosanthes scabra]